MTTRTYIILGILAVAALAGLLVIQAYSLDLIQYVVVHALIQKAPGPSSSEHIEGVFNDCLANARARGREDEYLGDLIRLSQKLEKLQRMRRSEVEEVLASFSTDWGKANHSPEK